MIISTETGMKTNLVFLSLISFIGLPPDVRMNVNLVVRKMFNQSSILVIAANDESKAKNEENKVTSSLIIISV